MTEEMKQEKTVESQEKKEETPETFKVKVAGEEKELTRDELIEHAQKGFDYTAKTQELAKDRKGFDKSVEAEVNKRFGAAMREKEASQKTKPPEEEEFDDPYEKRFREQDKKIDTVTEENRKLKEARDVARFNRELDGFVSKGAKFPKANRDIVVKKMWDAQQRGEEPNLEEVCEEVHNEQEAHDAQLIKDYRDGKIKDGKQTVEGKGGTPTHAAPKNIADMPIGSAEHDAAVAEFLKSREEAEKG